MKLIAATTEPNAADWFTAVGTVGTLALSVLLALFSFRDRQRNQAHDHRAQASKVYGLATGLGGSGTAGEKMTLNYEAVVKNNSDLPITDVEVMLAIEPAAAVLGSNQISPQKASFILPGGTLTHRAPVVLRYQNGEVADHEAHLWIAFTDASGTRWERLPGQRLVEHAKKRDRWSGRPG